MATRKSYKYKIILQRSKLTVEARQKGPVYVDGILRLLILASNRM